MERGRLSQAPDEYRQLFQFFFVLRAIALAYALVLILFKVSRGENYLPALAIWAGIIVYTALIYAKRRELYTLLLKHPAYLGFDILVCILLLNVYTALNSPFYIYSASPVIPAAVLFRFRGAMLSSVLLSAGQIVSVLLHGTTLQDMFLPEYFPILLGQTSAYFIVGYMCIYPADMISEIVRQRSVIKRQTEKEAIYEERARLACELHDNLGQMLSAIKHKTDQLLEKFGKKSFSAAHEICELAALSLQDLRNAIFALRPENIEKDLGQMLADYCHHFSSTTGYKVITCLSIDGVEISSEQKYEILRICQEALSNASRHSGTVLAKLEAKKKNHRLTITIEDEGKGFDLTETEAGVGFSSMQERARKLGGTLEITSAAGAGTKVKLIIPL